MVRKQFRCGHSAALPLGGFKPIQTNAGLGLNDLKILRKSPDKFRHAPYQGAYEEGVSQITGFSFRR
jgi:hypothetical protein